MAEGLSHPAADLAVGDELGALNPPQKRHERDVDHQHEQGERPRVPEHHGDRADDDRGVDDPADQPPLGKAGEGLDVGRDPSDEHPASAFGVVGEAQMVDVLEDTDPQIHQHRLGHVDEPDQGDAARSSDEQDDSEGGQADGPHIGAVVAVVGQHAVVEHELHEDRHDEATDCGGERHDDGDRKTSAELRRDLDAARHHGEGTDRRCFVIEERGGLVECRQVEGFAHEPSPCS